MFIDPFRPGVCERLGIGPEVVCDRNPRMIYGRMTGFGQDGPLAQVAGHDIDYIAMSGALWLLGREGEKPTPPINLLGDFAGGGLMLALGIAAAAFERSVLWCRAGDRRRDGRWRGAGGGAVLLRCLVGLLGSARHEPDRHRRALLRGLRVRRRRVRRARERSSRSSTPNCCSASSSIPPSSRSGTARVGESSRHGFAEIFLGRTRAQWCEVLEGTEACFSPVLSPAEAVAHPHNVERGTFVEVNGVTLPGPAPRFGRTPAAAGTPNHPGSHTEAARAGTLWP